VTPWPRMRVDAVASGHEQHLSQPHDAAVLRHDNVAAPFKRRECVPIGDDHHEAGGAAPFRAVLDGLQE
jgi:hypothetical protein